MNGLSPIAVSLCALMATSAVASEREPSRDMQNLLDHGFKLLAEGKLMSGFRCDPQFAGITVAEIHSGYTCSSGQAIYGSFKRLKGDEGEFVCLSFRGWACYPSQVRIERWYDARSATLIHIAADPIRPDLRRSSGSKCLGARGCAGAGGGLQGVVAVLASRLQHLRRPAAQALPERDIAVRLNPDATFAFPYGDGYWSKLLNRSFKYEDELELLFRDFADVDYTLLDCGANYGYWSVLVSSKPFGSRKAIAIEPSSKNFARLSNNAKINGSRFEVMQSAIGATRGTARLSGTKHEAFSIAGGADAGGEVVPVVALDNLLDDGKISPDGKYLIKLDVEGVEIEAIKGGTRVLQGDAVILCEEHGNDRNHTVSRYILEQTPLDLIVHDPASDRFETLTELSILDRIKVASHVGYNVFGTSSAFWQDRFRRLNATASQRVH